MHTTKILRSEDFIYKVNEKESKFESVFPHFNKYDRLGIIVSKPGGTIGVSVLLMAAITKFYDFYRFQLGNEHGKLRIYPDYFIFHIGKFHMNHFWMDIWPSHKEILVSNNPQSILEAVNDRGITRLIVEDIPSTPTNFLRETISSAENRIVSALAYSPTGRVINHDISITSCSIVEKLIKDSLKSSGDLSEKMYGELRNKVLDLEGHATETYRRIQLSDALYKLTLSG
ncbi:hypothetical protein [Pseudalkalibacillus salsuginis]|uniref:hypothetical protein n=1 Tax=Pseudalkalibacillus salsuginis TaxID=2910972 RepID=UPI001F3C1576|nr:hypothetical protein [Pseudalkalibacillus salsuginis]MCF6409693.1 hypothetical protein [Pseudalkalibacillus salsuginis]